MALAAEAGDACPEWAGAECAEEAAAEGTPEIVPFAEWRVGPTMVAFPWTLISPLPLATRDASVPSAEPFTSVTWPLPSASTAVGAFNVQSVHLTRQLPLAVIAEPAVNVRTSSEPSLRRGVLCESCGAAACEAARERAQTRSETSSDIATGRHTIERAVVEAHGLTLEDSIARDIVARWHAATLGIVRYLKAKGTGLFDLGSWRPGPSGVIYYSVSRGETLRVPRRPPSR